MQKSTKAHRLLGHRPNRIFRFKDIPGLQTRRKKRLGHDFFETPLISIADPGKPYSVASFGFFQDIKILNLIELTLNTVPLHKTPDKP
jgi:hypothetical protein